MQIVKKIQAKIVPNTLAAAYTKVKAEDLNFSVLKFQDGSLRVKIENPEVVTKSSTLYVEAYLQNMDDLMIASQLRDIVYRLTNGAITSVLTISSPVYSRYDRVMLDDQSDALGARVFGDFVDAAKYHIVRYIDCHSKFLVDQTTNAHDITQYNILEMLHEKYPYLKDLPTIAPDKGAVKKNQAPSVVFDKVRDVTNGKITGMTIAFSTPHNPRDNVYLVVDDLCEGGRTFLELADEFKRSYTELATLNLYVTHGLFTNNAIPKLLEKYSNIYVYIMKASVYYALTENEMSRVNVMYLVDDTN